MSLAWSQVHQKWFIYCASYHLVKLIKLTNETCTHVPIPLGLFWRLLFRSTFLTIVGLMWWSLIEFTSCLSHCTFECFGYKGLRIHLKYFKNHCPYCFNFWEKIFELCTVARQKVQLSKNIIFSSLTQHSELKNVITKPKFV